jgi:hypothetical protein
LDEYFAISGGCSQKLGWWIVSKISDLNGEPGADHLWACLPVFGLLLRWLQFCGKAFLTNFSF